MKFKTEDTQYIEARRRLSEESGPRELWSVIDHWPLFAGIANIGRFLAIADLLRSTLEVPGHVAEFGAWRGANTLWLAKLLTLFDPHASKTIHSFDSFEGLQTFSSEDGTATENRAAYKGNLEEMEACIELYRLQDTISIHVGLIQDTLPQLLDERPGLSLSFVYCDTDLYEPTKLILESLHGRLSKGGLFVFDQWNYDQWPGESLAVREFLSDHGAGYEPQHVMHARQPSLVLRKTIC
jgi:predicted O-methyltransferase YrrM